MTVYRITNPRHVAAFALEGGVIFGVLYGLAALTMALLPYLAPEHVVAHVALTALVFAACLFGTRKARLGDEVNLRREITLVAMISLAIGGLSFLAFWALFDTPGRLQAFLMLEGAIAVPVVVTTWRWILTRYRVLDGYRERVMILGTGEHARQACREITENHPMEYVVVGFAGDDPSAVGNVLAMGVRILTDFASLEGHCRRRVDRILVALDEKRGTLPLEPLMQLRLRGMEIEEATSFFERISGKIGVETMLPSWLIFSEGFKSSAARRAAKRLADIVVSLSLVVLTAPLLALLMVLIRLDSKGPALYRQKRVGRNGKEFYVLKFRSMVVDAEERSGPTWAHKDDPRVTRVGRIIRKLRIDELPQVLNVLRGEMSFVGPRPERRHFVEQLEKIIPYYGLRMSVRPGLTGWAQVQYGYGATVEESLEKLKYDLYYIKNCNPLFDLWICVKTVKVLMMGSGAR
jgi:sugar transferase (PEP-CTERM system associated)